MSGLTPAKMPTRVQAHRSGDEWSATSPCRACCFGWGAYVAVPEAIPRTTRWRIEHWDEPD